MTNKDARLDIKTSKVAKVTLEQAASVLGTTLSAFMLESALTKARQVIAETKIINLCQEEAERFSKALQNPPKPNQKLKTLFKKHKQKA